MQAAKDNQEVRFPAYIHEAILRTYRRYRGAVHRTLADEMRSRSVARR